MPRVRLTVPLTSSGGCLWAAHTCASGRFSVTTRSRRQNGCVMQLEYLGLASFLFVKFAERAFSIRIDEGHHLIKGKLGFL
jgi:hypothetical protein